MSKVQHNTTGIQNFGEPDRYAERHIKERRQKILDANKRTKLIDSLHNFNIFPEQAHNSWSYNLTCPFPAHKNGKENSPSFGYNFAEDRFNCFGCKKSGKTVEFISNIEQVDPVSIAEKILLSNNYDENIIEVIRFDLRKPLFEFSDYIYYLIHKNKDNKTKLDNIDKILWWFNEYLSSKHPYIYEDELKARIEKVMELTEDYV